MSDTDADAIRLRRWQADMETRLSVLEGRLGGPVVGSGLDEGDKRVIAELESRLDVVETLAKDTSGVLAGVEAALGSHSHPTEAPAQPLPAVSTAAPGA